MVNGQPCVLHWSKSFINVSNFVSTSSGTCLSNSATNPHSSVALCVFIRWIALVKSLLLPRGLRCSHRMSPAVFVRGKRNQSYRVHKYLNLFGNIFGEDLDRLTHHVRALIYPYATSEKKEYSGPGEFAILWENILHRRLILNRLISIT